MHVTDVKRDASLPRADRWTRDPTRSLTVLESRRAVAQGQVARLNRTLRPLLDGRRVGYVRKRLSGIAQPVYTAQIGYESRGEAYAFCIRLKRLGGNCIVLKN